MSNCLSHLINQTSKVDVHVNLKLVHTYGSLDLGTSKVDVYANLKPLHTNRSLEIKNKDNVEKKLRDLSHDRVCDCFFVHI